MLFTTTLTLKLLFYLKPEIRKVAFENCHALTEIFLPEVKMIDERAFASNKNLIELSLPSTINLRVCSHKKSIENHSELDYRNENYI